jgi:hypothetical protein
LKVNWGLWGICHLQPQCRRLSQRRNLLEADSKQSRFLLGVLFDPEDRGDMYLRNVGWINIHVFNFRLTISEATINSTVLCSWQIIAVRILSQDFGAVKGMYGLGMEGIIAGSYLARGIDMCPFYVLCLFFWLFCGPVTVRRTLAKYQTHSFLQKYFWVGLRQKAWTAKAETNIWSMNRKGQELTLI